MYILSDHIKSIGKSENLVRTIEAARNLYDGILEFIGGFFARLIIVAFGIPIMRVLFFFANRSLKKDFRKLNFESVDNPTDYKEIREAYDRLGVLMKRLGDVKIDPKEVSFVVRGVIMQINEFENLIKGVHNNLKVFLDRLDDGIEESQSFKYISEEDLWNSRTKAYEYKL